MMRKLIVFLLIFSTALAACEEYVISAENDFDASLKPADCFGVAGRYSEAAACYMNDNQRSTAEVYFQKAADYYLQCLNYAGPAGDYPLRAPSYESAGDMEVQIGNLNLAASYYTSAISEYLKTDNYEKADEVQIKKAALEAKPAAAPATGWAISGDSLAAGGIIVVIAVAMFLFFKRPVQIQQEPVRHELPPMKFEVREEPKMGPRESAKEKMRDKIRKKYGLE